MTDKQCLALIMGQVLPLFCHVTETSVAGNPGREVRIDIESAEKTARNIMQKAGVTKVLV